MATIKRFEDLEIWKEARRLSKLIFELTLQPEFKLKEQIKSASGSIMDNIAEGSERGGNMEFR